MKDITPYTDKPKGQLSIREAASLELPEQHLGMERRGTTVHGFGDGQAELPMQAHTGQSGVGEAVMELIERMTRLPFHAQLSVLRMMAPRILGVMDGRDRDIFLNDLRRELMSMMMSDEEHPETPMMMMDEQDIQGT